MVDVKMDYEVVQAMADRFGNASDGFRAVENALRNVSNHLLQSAMFGLVGNLANAFYLERIATRLDKLEKYCAEMQGDLYNCIRYYRDGDTNAKSRFM